MKTWPDVARPLIWEFLTGSVEIFLAMFLETCAVTKKKFHMTQ